MFAIFCLSLFLSFSLFISFCPQHLLLLSVSLSAHQTDGTTIHNDSCLETAKFRQKKKNLEGDICMPMEKQNRLDLYSMVIHHLWEFNNPSDWFSTLKTKPLPPPQPEHRTGFERINT
jgi:hypothetical protein